MIHEICVKKMAEKCLNCAKAGCASRSAHGGVVGKLAARCRHVHSRWQLVFLPLHHMLTYLHIAQPVFAQFRLDVFSQFWNYGKNKADS